MTALFVYCGLVSPRCVAGQNVKLLRAVMIPHGSQRENFVREFQYTHYLGVECGSHRSISVHIYRDDGSPVTFEGGTVIVTLHLKKRKRYRTQTMEPFKCSDSHTFYNKYYTVQSGTGLHVYRGCTVVLQRGDRISSLLASITNKAPPPHTPRWWQEGCSLKQATSLEICCLEKTSRSRQRNG